MSEKLQKVLANAGFGSRREIESWIQAGRIKVNGETAILGARVTQDDKINLDNRLVKLTKQTNQSTRILLYHKPEGEVCSRQDEKNRLTVFEKLPKIHSGRWIMVGRLDINTAGLLLFTNNGELAHRLMHPSYRIKREYAVRVFGDIEKKKIDQLLQGVQLDDGPACFEEIKDRGGQGRNHWYHVLLREGRQHEVRRLWESVGLKVSRLIRIGFAGLVLPRSVRQGKYRELTSNEIESLSGLVDLDF